MARDKFSLNKREQSRQNRGVWDRKPTTPSGLYGNDLAAFMVCACLDGKF